MAGAGHALILTTTFESYCSQFLESIITPTLTMLCGWWALTPGSAPFAGLSLDPDQGQGSLQISFFHGRIENWSQDSTNDTRDWENYRRYSWGESDHSNCEQRHKKFSFDDTADDELIKP